jgi:hypothetical protein
MQYGMYYMHRCDQSGGHEMETLSPAHQTGHTDACETLHTTYKTASLRMNPQSSKHVRDIRN